MFHRRADHRGARARHSARKLGYKCRTEFTLQVAKTPAVQVHPTSCEARQLQLVEAAEPIALRAQPIRDAKRRRGGRESRLIHKLVEHSRGHRTGDRIFVLGQSVEDPYNGTFRFGLLLVSDRREPLTGVLFESIKANSGAFLDLIEIETMIGAGNDGNGRELIEPYHVGAGQVSPEKRLWLKVRFQGQLSASRGLNQSITRAWAILPAKATCPNACVPSPRSAVRTPRGIHPRRESRPTTSYRFHLRGRRCGRHKTGPWVHSATSHPSLLLGGTRHRHPRHTCTQYRAAVST